MFVFNFIMHDPTGYFWQVSRAVASDLAESRYSCSVKLVPAVLN